jgi:hypothetical protein
MERRMEQRHLKSLVESGNYRPEPELVACAMLRRRGVRTLLTGTALNPAGRIPPASEAPRQAA